MNNFAHNLYTLGKIGLGKQTLGNLTIVNLTMGILPFVMVLKNVFFLIVFCCCLNLKVKDVPKKDRFATKIAYV